MRNKRAAYRKQCALNAEAKKLRIEEHKKREAGLRKASLERKLIAEAKAAAAAEVTTPN